MEIQERTKIDALIIQYFDAYLHNRYNSLYRLTDDLKIAVLDAANDQEVIHNYLYYIKKLLINKEFKESFTGSNFDYTEKYEAFTDAIMCHSRQNVENLLFLSPEQSVLAFEQYTIEELCCINKLPVNLNPVDFYYPVRNAENRKNVFFLYDKSQKLDYCEYVGKIMPMNNENYDGLYDYHIPIFKLFEQSTDYNITLTNNYELIDGSYIYVHTVAHITEFLIKNENNLYQTISPTILKDINSGKAIYILNSSQEGVPIAPYYYIIRQFLSNYISQKYHNNFIILSGNVFEKKTIQLFNQNKFIPGFKIVNSFKNKISSFRFNAKINLYAFSYFEYCISLQYKRHYQHYSYEEKLKSLSEHTFKTFLCFNGHEKDFRYAICYLLWKKNLLRNGSVSLRKINGVKELAHPHNNKIIKKVFKKDAEEFDCFLRLLPLVADKKNVNLNYWYQVDLNLINHTFLWIITETTFGDNYFNFSFSFLTEKTYKPIALFMPFVMVGDRYSLKRLKQEGYKTFDKWWNEGYDNIADAVERLNAILQIIAELCSKTNQETIDMYMEMKDVLQHNHFVLMSKSKVSFFENILANEL